MATDSYTASLIASAGMTTTARRGAKVLHPNCDNAWGPFAIAGPANLTDSPWNFPLIPNALNLQAGQHYVFFVAE